MKLSALSLLAASSRRLDDLSEQYCLFENMFAGLCTFGQFCADYGPYLFDKADVLSYCSGEETGLWSITVDFKPQGCHSTADESLAFGADISMMSEAAPFCSHLTYQVDFDKMVAIRETNEVIMVSPQKFTIEETFSFVADPQGQFVFGNTTYSYDSTCPAVTIDGQNCRSGCVEFCTATDFEVGVPDCTNIDARLNWNCDYTKYNGPEYYGPLFAYASDPPAPTDGGAADAPVAAPVATQDRSASLVMSAGGFLVLSLVLGL